jgi:hypothetical protein
MTRAISAPVASAGHRDLPVRAPAGLASGPAAEQMTAGIVEMYLVTMDQLAREDIAAAAAAHHELGREYDDAVAESLVERIGAEIDKRVDTRLGQRGRRPAPRDPEGPVSQPRRTSSLETILVALGSMTIGGVTAVNILNGSHAGGGAVVALIWVVIAVVNIAYARRR